MTSHFEAPLVPSSGAFPSSVAVTGSHSPMDRAARPAGLLAPTTRTPPALTTTRRLSTTQKATLAQRFLCAAGDWSTGTIYRISRA